MAVLRDLVAAVLATGIWGATAAAADPLPPIAPREFRAAWVATVENIDWPSKKGLSGTEQQKEIVAILDKSVELKLNCLIVQIRTSADALYPSKLEPWSIYLSGTQGVPPTPQYDPLKTWIDEGHKRGIEIHAWFNPYRARAGNPKAPLSLTHLSKRRPDLVKQYGNYLWIDPGEPDAAKHSLAVFNDVVRRYDVDGIHIDDYFYPYPIKASWAEDAKNTNPDEAEKKARAARPDLDFPDDESWAKYKKDHPVKPNPATKPADVERVAREDWRRQNVDNLIRDIYVTTKKIKPHVKFGISPFGIGRPGTAPGISGFDQYSKLYADAQLWLNNGWCDYYTPQLYWPIAQKAQSFPVLFDYWRSENKMNRHIWPGLFTSKIIEKPKPTTQPVSGGEAALNATTAPTTGPTTQPWLWSAKEIADQIAVTRSRDPLDAGHVHFSMKALQRDFVGVSTLLKSETYATDALVPATPWLDDKAPPTPTVKLDAKTKSIVLKPGSGEATWLWAVWTRTPSGWQFKTIPGTTRSAAVDPSAVQVVVTAVDRCGNESERVSVMSN